MDFQHFYDGFQSSVDYDQLLQPILNYIDNKDTILDAGCGPGHILSHLIQSGYNAYGLDIDERMLELANKNMDHPQSYMRLFLHDLRKPLHHRFDKILCLLDVFHYFKGVLSVAKNLYHALNDGGMLILDLYRKPIDASESGTFLDYTYDWQVHTKNARIYHNISLKNKDDVIDYEVIQYYYDKNYYINVLKRVGFQVETFKGFDDRKIYLVCKK